MKCIFSLTILISVWDVWYGEGASQGVMDGTGTLEYDS